MANDWLNTFKEKDFLKGSEIAFENAQNHFESAKILRADNQIGFAISHLIYSAEESIKSVVLLQKYLHIPLGDDLISDFFTTHNTKHIANKIFSSFHSIFYRTIQNLKDFASGNSNKSIEDVRDEVFKNLFDGFRAKPKSAELKALYDFWNSAENYRVRGMYVEPENKGWWYPNKFKAKTYTKVEKIIEDLLKYAKGMKEFVTAPESNEFVRQAMGRNDGLMKKLEEFQKQSEGIIKKLNEDFEKKKS